MASYSGTVNNDSISVSVALNAQPGQNAQLDGQSDDVSGDEGADYLNYNISSSAYGNGISSIKNVTGIVAGDAGQDQIQLSTYSYSSYDYYNNNSIWTAVASASSNRLVGTGGEGDDYLYSGLNAQSSYGGNSTTSDNKHTLSGDVGNDTLVSFMGTYTYGGTATLSGNTVTLDGGAGDDSLRSESFVVGNVIILNGGEGTDSSYINRQNSTRNLTLDLSLDPSLVQALGDGTQVSGIERVEFYGGSGNDSITGGALNDTIDGGSGSDTLSGEAGDDTLRSGNNFVAGNTLILSGGEGTDSAYIYRQNSTRNLTLDLSLDPSVVQALGDGTQVSGIERVEFYGGSGNDSITGGALNDFIDGGSGSDTLSGEAGDDTLRSGNNFVAGNTLILSGGEGTDFAYIYRQNSTQNLSLDLSLDPSVVQALGDGTQVSGIERVEFYGGSGNDSITGGALNDTIDGGSGSDTLSGGAGDDYIRSVVNSYSYYSNTGKSVSGLRSNFLGGDGRDSISFDLSSQSQGSGSANVSDIEYTSSGNAGDDTIQFSLGSNTYYSSSASTTLGNTVSIAGGFGNDYVSGYMYAGSYGSGVTTTKGNFYTVNGEDGNDSVGINASSYSNYSNSTSTLSENTAVVAGGEGDDYLFSSLSAQTYYANNATTSGNEHSLSGDAGNDTLVSSIGTYAYGGGTATLSGNTVTLDGGAGDDALRSDSFVTGNTLILSGGEGTDFAYIYRQNSTQNLSLDLSLDPSVVQALGDGTQVSGIERVEFYGGSGNDSITGGALNDTIDGGDGSDTVIFAGSRKNYDIAVEGSQLRVTDSQSGASDLLTNIEAYIFDGQRYDATYLLTNHIPFVANPIPDQTAIEDTAFSFVVPDNAFDDPDTGGRLIYSAQLVDSSGNPAGTGALPSWLQFDAATRTFTGTPPSNFNGSLTLRVSASDGTLSAMSDFVLTVNAVNDLPTVSQPVTVAIDEDASPFSTSLLQGAFDVDADALMVQNLMLVEGNAAGITPSEQNLLVDPGAYAYLAAGESAVLRYTYAISDGHDGSIDQSATITVEGRNDAPVLQSGSPLFVSEAENVTNQPLSAPITASGSLSFTDADLSDTHLTATTFVAAVLPSGGTVPSAVEDALRGALAARVETDSTGSGAGTLAWTFSLSDALGSFLAAGQTLVVTYDVTIDDQHTGGTSTQPVAITITGANDVPVISASVDTGTKSFGEFTQGQSGLSTAGTLNVADPDLADRVAITRQDVATTGDAGGLTREQLLAMLTVGPTALAADPGSTGNLGWSFDSGGTSFAYLGAGDTLDLLYTIRATDDSGGIGDGTVAIRILGTNDAPVAAQPLSGQSVNEDTAWLYTVPADTFTDVDGDTLALSATLADGTALPTWLRFDATSRTFSGTPPSNFNGSLALRVTASDGTLSATSDFTLAVNAVNDAPVVARALVGQSVNEDTAWSYTVPAGTFTDVDGNALTLSATLASGSDLPAWVSFDAATGRFSGTPPLNFNGSLALRVTASDGTLSAASDFTLTVNPVNDAPVVSREIPDQYVRQGTAFTYQVPAGTFTDVDSSALTLSATRTGGGTLPSWLTFNAATGTFSGTPTGSEDLVAVTVRASDGSLSATDTFELRIGRSLSGGNSADSLVGGIGNDTIRGGNGDDLLRGGSGRDLLFGDNGADRLEGGADNDVLTGGSGDDLLIGGTGRDLYVFGKANGADRIQNGFTLGEDFLQLIEGVTIRSVTNAGGNTVVQLASGSVASGTVTIEGLTGATAATLLVSNGTLGTDGALT